MKHIYEDKTEFLRFKLGVKLYQLTGYLSDFCRDAEDQYIHNNLDKFLATYQSNEYNETRTYGSFATYISLQQGMFQCDNGIYRRSFLLDRGLLPKIYQLYYYNVSLPISRLLKKYKI